MNTVFQYFLRQNLNGKEVNEVNGVDEVKQDNEVKEVKDDKTVTLNEQKAKQVDLVFVIDSTGSMGSYIQSAKENSQKIVDQLVQKEGFDVRVAIISYRDHPPQDSSYITKVFEFSSNTDAISQSLASLNASGGGDGPEALTTGLYEAGGLSWRQASTKVCILITDAPPHGIGESGDGFPNGEPNGHDPIAIARSFAERGIAIYPVGCEPTLSSYRNASAFMVSLAEITEGYATSLSSASLLADVILGSTIEEVGLQQLMTKYENDVRSIKSEQLKNGMDESSLSDEIIMQELYSKMILNREVTKTHNCDGKMNDARASIFTNKLSLVDARPELLSNEDYLYITDSSRLMSVAFTTNSSATTSKTITSSVSYEQCQRVYSKMKKQSKC